MKFRKILISFISVAAAFSIALGSVALTNFISYAQVSDDGYIYSENLDGTITISKYNGEQSEILIPDEIDGKKVTAIGDMAFSGCTFIKSVEIPDTVEKIGSAAFYDCRLLETAVIPDSVTKLGVSAFSGCTSLKSLYLPLSLTEQLDEEDTDVEEEADTSAPEETPVSEEETANISEEADTSAPEETPVSEEETTDISEETDTSAPEETPVSEEEIADVEEEADTSAPEETPVSEEETADISEETDTSAPEETPVSEEETADISEEADNSAPEETPVSEEETADAEEETSDGSDEENTSFNIDLYAFQDCFALNDVYFAGSEADWNEVTVGAHNAYLLTADFHFEAAVEDMIEGDESDMLKLILEKPDSEETDSGEEAASEPWSCEYPLSFCFDEDGEAVSIEKLAEVYEKIEISFAEISFAADNEREYSPENADFKLLVSICDDKGKEAYRAEIPASFEDGAICAEINNVSEFFAEIPNDYTAEFTLKTEILPDNTDEINDFIIIRVQKPTVDGAYEESDESDVSTTELTTESIIEPETETTTEPTAETTTEFTTEPEPETTTELTTESITEPETETATEPEPEITTELETEPVTESETELETEAATELTTEPEPEPDDDSELSSGGSGSAELIVYSSIFTSEMVQQAIDEASGDEIQLYITDNMAVLSADAVRLIADSGLTVVFRAESGYQVTLKASDITEQAKELAFDFSMIVRAAGTADGAQGLPADESDIVVEPGQKGDFLMTLTLTIPAETIDFKKLDEAKLYYISDNGDVEDYSDRITVNPDRSVSLTLTHASRYLIKNPDSPSASDVTIGTQAIGTVTDPYINVTMPVSASVVINPYRLKINTGTDENGDDIFTQDTVVSPEYSIVNNSEVAIDISVSSQITSTVKIASEPFDYSEKDKILFFYIESRGEDGYLNEYSEDNPSQMAIFNGNSKSIMMIGAAGDDGESETGCFKIRGEANSYADEIWTSEDEAVINLIFDITPIVDLEETEEADEAEGSPNNSEPSDLSDNDEQTAQSEPLTEDTDESEDETSYSEADTEFTEPDDLEETVPPETVPTDL